MIIYLSLSQTLNVQSPLQGAIRVFGLALNARNSFVMGLFMYGKL